MKQYLKAGILVLLLTPAISQAYTSTTLDELKKASETKNKSSLILDVRSEGEYASGHVPGSINIGFREVGNAKNLKTIKAYKEVYVYCHVGGRASMACKTLESKNINVKCASDFGMKQWKSHSYPTVK